MKVHRIIVDDQNDFFSVALESGEEFIGVKALDQIMMRHRDPKLRNKPGFVREKDLEPYIDSYGRRYLRKLKAEASAKNKTKWK